MSTQPINLKLITKVVDQLYDLRENNIDNSTPTGKRLNNAVNTLFNNSKFVDKTGNNQEKQNLFYVLWKGNQKSLSNLVESGVLSNESIEAMQGTTVEHRNEVVQEVVKLAEPDVNNELIRDNEGFAFLAGMYANINNSIDKGAVIEPIYNSINETFSALISHSLSLESNYEKNPKGVGSQKIASALYSLANNGDQFFGADRAVKGFLFNKFESEGMHSSGMERVFYGPDVLSTIVDDVLSGKDVRIPISDIRTDTAIPSLVSRSELAINITSDIPKASISDRGLVTSSLHHVLDAIEKANFTDYNGNFTEKVDAIDSIKTSLRQGVDSLDLAAMEKSRSYNIGFDWAPTERVEQLDSQFSY